MQTILGFCRMKRPFNFYEAMKNHFTLTTESGVDQAIWVPQKFCLCMRWNCPMLHIEKMSPALYAAYFFSCQEQLNFLKGTSVSHGKYQECRVHISKCNLQTVMTIIGIVCTHTHTQKKLGHLNESGTSAQGENDFYHPPTASTRAWDTNASP